MRVRIHKSRQHNTPSGVDNLRVARVLLDLIARRDRSDLAVTNQHSAIGNDCQLAHFRANARSLRSSQRD
jgi:hypothetical protein